MPYGETIGAEDVESVLPSDFLGRVAWRRAGRRGKHMHRDERSTEGTHKFDFGIG